jgi:hypothetical protein
MYSRAGRWTWPQGILASVLVLLGIAITVPAFTQMYRTAVGLLSPYMGWWAWTVPVCGEIAFAFLFLNGVLLQLRKAPAGGLRAALMASIITSSLLLQVYSARRSVPDAVGHAVVVVAFFGVMSAGKQTIMALRGGKIRADAMTFGEWAAHPLHSLRLWRWMKAWGEPSRDVAQQRYMRLLFAIAVAQAAPSIGGAPFAWRRRLPVTLRYELATGYLPDCSGADWQATLTRHIRRQLHDGRSGSFGDTGNDAQGVVVRGSLRGTETAVSGAARADAVRDSWPHSRNVDRPALVRRAQNADRKHQERFGKPIPAAQLGAALRVVMSRETAKSILDEARAPGLKLAARQQP